MITTILATGARGGLFGAGGRFKGGTDPIMEKFNGGPVGIDNLAAAIGEARDTIEDVLEPFLIQQGYILRTPRGRMVTRNAYLHFGLPAPRSSQADVSGNFPLDLADDGQP